MRLRCTLAPAPKPGVGRRAVATVVVVVVVVLGLLCSGILYAMDCITSPAAQYARRRECLSFGLEAGC
ncbi:hypothetical protein EJ03DRAFT_328375 [Teratosphaeria nubilosa]|uniref:Uncharacterized protein n=1 Tax=Teratosphaeria nubilosa TaxID=161662 RepID=A0A6G1L702_9PEZI|nr:hypothetical protein EJ03DRAFT_328375 [Teratosphaeria nubilosa]